MSSRRKRLNETSLSDDEDTAEVDIASKRAPEKRVVRKRVRGGAEVPSTSAGEGNEHPRKRGRQESGQEVIDIDQPPDAPSTASVPTPGATTVLPAPVAPAPGPTEHLGDASTGPSSGRGDDDTDQDSDFIGSQPSSESSEEADDEDEVEVDDSTASANDAGKDRTSKTVSARESAPRKRTSSAKDATVRKKKRRNQKSKHDAYVDPQAVDASGMLADLGHVAQESDAPATLGLTADVNAFFSPIVKEGKKKYRTCLICKERKVSDGTTCRRHVDRYHRTEYNKWCSKNKFELKLESYKAEKEAAASEKASGMPATVQSSLDSHLVDKPPPYSDALLRQAIIDWLVETNQPLSAVDHPRFRQMLEIASRAKNGIKIPSRKATRAEILQVFRQHMADLKKRLNSSIVLGLISSTCDCWLADNQDGYFAVTGHWIEAPSPGLWELKTDLFGYVAIQESHSGKRLGQALYRVFERIGIADKMGWTTCDGVDVNDVMMAEVEVWQVKNGVFNFKSEERRIFCNAHIINLPVQDFIKARADPKRRTDGQRDEISLVRDIAVKQRSGAMRKLRFHKLAAEKGLKPRNLLRDMPVRWSSSSFMLDRAWVLKAIVNKFVFDLKEDEKNQKKKAALAKMLIEDDEWVRIDLDREIFHLADAAQQMFSAERYPTLYNAMPALVSLLAAWKKRRTQPKFNDVAEALDAAIAKLQKHVNKVRLAALSASPYWVTMVLHPDFKLGKRFNKFWNTLAADFESKMESLFKERYEKLHKPSTRATTSQAPQQSSRLLDELSDDDEATGTSGSSSQPSEPWKTEYRAWLDAHHELGKDMTLVRMWGVLATQYPTWASLAADYLAVMGSSVSSERAFSGGGLVITGQRGSLKGDIVEALQCIKCALRNDLLTHAPLPSSILEQQLVVEDSDTEDDAAQSGGVEWTIEIVDSESEDT